MRIGVRGFKKESRKSKRQLSPKARFRGAVYAVIAINIISRSANGHKEWNEVTISRLSIGISTSRNFWVPRFFIHDCVVYDLTLLQRFFVTFEYPLSSFLSGLWFSMMVTTILLGVVLFVAAGTPEITKSPSECTNPTCYNDPDLCPGRMVCEPEAPQYFETIDTVCVIIFTVDYLLRLLTCWCVPPPLAGVTDDLAEEMSSTAQVIRFFLRISNLIDLCAITPFYVDLIEKQSSKGGSESSSFIRVLRLSRLLRVLKLGKGSEIIEVLGTALKSSSPAIMISLFFVALFTVAVASIFSIVEQGTFTVNSDYPDGAFIRPNLAGDGLEKSPFASISEAIYYVIITQATVGYGDIYPTSRGGRALAGFLAHVGVLVLALPISVIGSHFADEYDDYVERKALRAKGHIAPDLLIYYEEFKCDLRAKKLLLSTSATQTLASNDDIGIDSLILDRHALVMGKALKQLRAQKRRRSSISSVSSTASRSFQLDVLLAKVRVELARHRHVDMPRKRRPSEREGTHYVPPPKLARKKPWIAPTNYKYYQQPIKRLYKLSWVGRIFVTLDDPDSSILGGLISYVMMITVLMSVISYVLMSIESHLYQYQPSTCESPACDNDPDLCPNRKVCQPQPISALVDVDTVCVIIFTIEFGIRLLTCWAVPARVAHVLLGTWDEEESFSAESEWRARRLDPPPNPWYTQVGLYFVQWFSLVDILAVIPSYVEMMYSGSSTSLSFVRVLRLSRALKIVKLFNGEEYAELVIKTMKKSSVALEIMAFMALLLVVFFGAVLYTCEHGNFKVSTDNPSGVYLRPTIVGDGQEQLSIFQSIALGIYWCSITTTTVGYGDFAPTTPEGRAMASIAAYAGLLVLAMPVGVIGNNFVEEYMKLVITRKKKRQFEEAELKIRENEAHGKPTSTSSPSAHAHTLANSKMRRHSDVAFECEPIDPFVLLRELVEYHRSSECPPKRSSTEHLQFSARKSKVEELLSVDSQKEILV